MSWYQILDYDDKCQVRIPHRQLLYDKPDKIQAKEEKIIININNFELKRKVSKIY